MPCLSETFFFFLLVFCKDILFDVKFQAFSILKMSFYCRGEEPLYSTAS